MDTFLDPAHVLAVAIPAVLLGGALRPRHAVGATTAALALAVLLAVVAGATGGHARGMRADLVGCAMLILVCGVGAVIARFSTTYLRGEPRSDSYARWLLVTLAAVTVLALSNSLLGIGIAWTATSVALHQLLTFYRDRPQAIVAAHKKFLVSRLADVCLWSAAALVGTSVGSWNLDRIAAWASAHPDLTPAMQLAAVLLVIAVALRSAQLPFHGWIIQVMEAPTPVSALLHAGVVNIGGFVLVRVAPWIGQSTIACVALVAIGTTTTVIAALVMTTRISVKVALAWSTCAQMGFMLVECGLGLWDLAMLHLVAHSLYKAHAFLSAGGAVERWRVHELAPAAERPSLARTALVAALALGLAGGACALAGATAASTWLVAALAALAVTPLLASRRGAHATRILAAGGALALYAAWHLGAGRLVALEAEPHPLALGIAAAGLLCLFVVKTVLARAPHGAFGQRAYPWLFAGGYLDDRVSRIAFRIWPPPLREATARAPRLPREIAEVRS